MNHYNLHTSCLITGAKDLETLKGYENNYLVKSKSSGFVFCERIPTMTELANHYKTYPRIEELPALTKKRYAELLDRFEPYRKTGNLIDVGCGNGLFLLEAKKRGWKIFGTEFSDEAISFCRSNGIEMKQGPLNPDDYEQESFDVITSFEVVEHINNPIEEGTSFYKMLRKGGLLYVTTPNFNCLERLVNGPEYDLIEYPEHLCYYTPRTLRGLFAGLGFDCLKMEAVNLNISKLKRQGPSSTESSGDSGLRENIESNPLLGFAKSVLNGILNLLGAGNALKGWFVKR